MCSDTTQMNYTDITIDNILENMPNVFTPNNDGKNDCFDFGQLIDFSDCSVIVVFDRWGEEIFKSGSGKECWNGKKNNTGKDFPTGTYFLTMVISGEKHKATITLLR